MREVWVNMMLDLGHEKRRVRFSSIAGIERADLPLAAEVWQTDLNQQVWAKRDMIKLGALFTSYMAEPNEHLFTVSYLERTFQMDVSALRETLRNMKMYGVVEAFTVHGGEVRVSLRLSVMQRLKVLEMRNRFLDLSGLESMSELHVSAASDQWDLTSPESDDAADAFADAV